LVRNLEDGVRMDRTPDQSVLVRGGSSAAETMTTAHWGSDSFWWHWYEGPVETTSFALQALVAVDPKSALIEPVMNWLVKNRRGAPLLLGGGALRLARRAGESGRERDLRAPRLLQARPPSDAAERRRVRDGAPVRRRLGRKR